MTGETYTVEHLGAVLASGLSEQDAARLILTHGGRRYEIRPHRRWRGRQRLYGLWVSCPLLAMAPTFTNIHVYARNLAEAEPELLAQVLNHSFTWKGYPEAFPDGADQ